MEANKPEHRFKALYHHLKSEHAACTNDVVKGGIYCRSKQEKSEAREAIRFALSKLDIPAPYADKIKRDVRWETFVGIMSVYAKDGRLEEARKLHDELHSLNCLYDE